MTRRHVVGSFCGALSAVALLASTMGACGAPAEKFGGSPGRKLTGGEGGETGAGGGSLFEDAGPDGPPPVDAAGLCGNQVHQVVTDAPNLYFVVDLSGSMAQPGGGGYSRYELVQHTAVQLVQGLGALANVGAAVFPKDATNAEPCKVGGEVMPIKPGDPGGNGKTTSDFIAATKLTPFGGTPTAATLNALVPKLLPIQGKTVVILATDGGPNCNGGVACSVAECIPNIEGNCQPAGTNCCAQDVPGGALNCLDKAQTLIALDGLKTAGFPVYVVGIPGSQLYANILNDMATAAGTAQPAAPYYYKVDDLALLLQAFQSIVSNVISCEFTLEDPPPDELHTNVYFDGVVVPQDPVNGWIWKSKTVLEMVGASCKAVKTGKVSQVQIVSGCPTAMPK